MGGWVRGQVSGGEWGEWGEWVRGSVAMAVVAVIGELVPTNLNIGCHLWPPRQEGAWMYVACAAMLQSRPWALTSRPAMQDGLPRCGV